MDLGYGKILVDPIRKAIMVGYIVTAALGITASISAAAIGKELVSEAPPLKCDIGPIAKSYGKTQWLVYSCNDQRTVVFVAAPDNPAMPFYFMIAPGENGSRLWGEGTGRKDATAAAFEEFKFLSQRDSSALIEQTLGTSN